MSGGHIDRQSIPLIEAFVPEGQQSE